jgi:hypothetical protein
VHFKDDAVKPDFAICDSDLVFDAAEVRYPRAKQLFDLAQADPRNLRIRRRPFVTSGHPFADLQDAAASVYK